VVIGRNIQVIYFAQKINQSSYSIQILISCLCKSSS